MAALTGVPLFLVLCCGASSAQRLSPNLPDGVAPDFISENGDSVGLLQMGKAEGTIIPPVGSAPIQPTIQPTIQPGVSATDLGLKLNAVYYNPATKLPPLAKGPALYKSEPDGNGGLSVTGSNASPTNEATNIDMTLDLGSLVYASGREYQGIGTAITDAALDNFKQMNKAAQDNMLASSFGTAAGIGYTFVRFPIGSCDFSLPGEAPYTYMDSPKWDSTGNISMDDFTLTPAGSNGSTVHWDDPNVAASRPSMFAVAKELSESSGRTLKAFGSAWSPPGWMKSAWGCVPVPGTEFTSSCSPGGSTFSAALGSRPATTKYDVGIGGCTGTGLPNPSSDIMTWTPNAPVGATISPKPASEYVANPCNSYGGHVSAGVTNSNNKPACGPGNGCNPDARKAYAQYLSKYVDVMQANGVDMVALTVQNEPEGAPGVTPWESNAFGTDEMAEFVKSFLIPELDAQDSKAGVWLGDSQVKFMPEYADAYGTPTESRLTGAGSHWYQQGPGEYMKDSVIQSLSRWLAKHESLHQSKQVLAATEQCLGFSSFICSGDCWGPARDYDEQISRAQTYARDIILKFQLGYNLWVDWNLILDQKQGGPNHAGGFVDAPLLRGGPSVSEDDFGAQPMYFYLGQISRHLPPGGSLHTFADTATGDAWSTFGPDNNKPSAPAIAVRGKNETAIVILNDDTSKDSINVLITAGSNHYEVNILKGGIATLVVPNDYPAPGPFDPNPCDNLISAKDCNGGKTGDLRVAGADRCERISMNDCIGQLAAETGKDVRVWGYDDKNGLGCPKGNSWESCCSDDVVPYLTSKGFSKVTCDGNSIKSR